MSLLDTIQGMTGVSNYCGADSVLIIANRHMEDYTNLKIDFTESFQEKEGIHEDYYITLKNPRRFTVTLTTLPDSDDSYFLRKLDRYVRANGGYFNMIVSNNGRYQGTMKCFVKKVHGIELASEPTDEVYVFGAVRPVHS